MNDSLDLLDLAARAAERAGAYIRQAAPSASRSETASSPQRPWEPKGHHDWASEVDREAERLITETLRAGTPHAGVVAEESSPDLVRSGLVWIVDPLDGTTNFLHGYQQYAVSVAAAIDGVLEAGVVLDVTRECRYGALRGRGAWCGSERLSVSDDAEPGRALLGTGFPFKYLEHLDGYLAQFRRLLPATSGIRRTGSAALDLADVAAGRLDGFWELQLAPWDIAAGVLLVREAGGLVTDLSGHDIGVEHCAVVAGGPSMHAWLLRQLAASAG